MIIENISLCMYVCMVIYVRATAYSLDCHVGAMINRRLYRTFQSLVVHRTAAVTSTGRELSVAMSSIELGQSMRSYAYNEIMSLCAGVALGYINYYFAVGATCTELGSMEDEMSKCKTFS